MYHWKVSAREGVPVHRGCETVTVPLTSRRVDPEATPLMEMVGSELTLGATIDELADVSTVVVGENLVPTPPGLVPRASTAINESTAR